MKIAVVSFWWNEARLAPFFLNHYAWADKILLVIDASTTDPSRLICTRYPNVEIQESAFPDGMLDDGIKINLYNSIVSGLDCDWVFAVDADEYIFPRNGEDPRATLARQSGNLLYAEMWNVYRHVTDVDLDPGRPAIEQRRHGDPIVQRGYRKPIIVKPEVGIQWMPGNHVYYPNDHIRLSAETFTGVHWGHAEADIAVKRYIAGRKMRLSNNNIRNGWGTENLNRTEESIRAECAAHRNDPQLF